MLQGIKVISFVSALTMLPSVMDFMTFSETVFQTGYNYN